MALDLGVSMIHQELHPISFRPVMENIWLGRFPMRGGIMVDHKKMYQMTKELFQKIDLDINPSVLAGTLFMPHNYSLLKLQKQSAMILKLLLWMNQLPH